MDGKNGNAALIGNKSLINLEVFMATDVYEVLHTSHVLAELHRDELDGLLRQLNNPPVGDLRRLTLIRKCINRAIKLSESL